MLPLPNGSGVKKIMGLSPAERLREKGIYNLNSNLEGFGVSQLQVEQVRFCSRLLEKPIN